MYRKCHVAVFGSALAFALGFPGCTSSETSLTAPTSDKCQISVTNSRGLFTASGGNGVVTISTSRDCPWSITTTASWVSLSGDHGGQGESLVQYVVAPNPVPVARSGSIVVGAARVQVDQAAAPCVFDLSRTRDTIGVSGGRLTVDVTTLTGCPWSAVSGASWISIVGGQSANATATVTLNVGANTGAIRVGEVQIAGKTYTVTQEGVPAAAPQPVPSPPGEPQPPPPPSSSDGKPVQVSGTVSGISGRCPDLRFTVSGYVVVTDKSTKFSDLSCRDIKNGRRVSVDGTTDSIGTVHARRVAQGE